MVIQPSRFAFFFHLIELFRFCCFTKIFDESTTFSCWQSANAGKWACPGYAHENDWKQPYKRLRVHPYCYMLICPDACYTRFYKKWDCYACNLCILNLFYLCKLCNCYIIIYARAWDSFFFHVCYSIFERFKWKILCRFLSSAVRSALDSVAWSLLLYDGLWQVRFPNIYQLIENSLIQKSFFPAVRLFCLFLVIPSADRSFPEANVSGLLMNNIRYKIKSWKNREKMRKRACNCVQGVL